MTATTVSLPTDVHGYGVLASRPAAGLPGREYHATDGSGTRYRDNGTSWDTLSFGAGASLTVEEVDGSPTDSAVTKIVFPNGTLGISSHVATYTPAGGGSDNISGQIGAGGATIPGLQASPDIRVAGTNDDEFDTTDTSDPMTGWTTLGTPSTHDINSTAKSHYYVKRAAGAGVGLIGIYKAIPSTPFTVTCKLADMTGAGDYHQGGLMVAEASPGKIETATMQNNAGPNKVGVNAWTNRTTYSSTPVALFISGGAPMYFRAVVASTTSVSWYWSQGGIVWTPLVLTRNPGFTIGSVGLYHDGENATYLSEAVFDWIRFT